MGDSMDDGFFVKGFVEDGAEDIPVGQIVALLAEDKDDCDKFDGYEPPEGSGESGEESSSKSESKEEKKSGDAPKTQKIDLNDKKAEKKSAPASEPKEEKPKATKSSAPKRKAGDRIVASPVARKRAEENGIDLANVEGSGPGGRIVLRDIEEYDGEVGSASASDDQVISTQSAQADYEDIPNSKIRKVIAQRLTESKQSIPHYYLTVECCVDRLQEVRQKLNEQGKGKYKISVNDFVIKASAMALRRVPDVNSDIGLFTPLISHADNKGLVDISSSVRELAGKAQDGKLTPDELQVGTFTVSNLGMFGIRNFAAVINPPQAAILAVGGIETRVVEENGSWKEANFMTCTLSCDHRVVDGAIGATWLKEFKSRMEDPIALLL